MSVSLDMSALVRLHRRLMRTPAQLEIMKREVLDTYAEKLLAQVIDNASGRPGPNRITGRYVNAMFIVSSGDSRKVTNLSPQTHRLEYGFVGTDSAGRNYHQPAFPHFRPALITVGKEFTTEMRKIPKKAWKATA